MAAGPSEEFRIPTLPLAESRLEEIEQLSTLPEELVMDILIRMDKSDLLNICAINARMLDRCFNRYLAIKKNWNDDEYIIFRLTLLSKCEGPICSQYKAVLNQELLDNPKFMANLKETSQDPGEVPLKELDVVNLLLKTTFMEIDGTDKPIDWRFFVNLKELLFYDDQPLNSLPASLKKLIVDGVFNQPLNLGYLSNLSDVIINNSGYNKPLDHLPINVKHLEIYAAYSRSTQIDLRYLANLNYLALRNYEPKLYQIITDSSGIRRCESLLPNIKTLNITGTYIIDSIYQAFLRPNGNLEYETCLPNTIIHIRLAVENYDKPIYALPKNIRLFEIDASYQHGEHIDVLKYTLKQYPSSKVKFI